MKKSLIAIIAALSLVLAACGSGDTDDNATLTTSVDGETTADSDTDGEGNGTGFDTDGSDSSDSSASSASSDGDAMDDGDDGSDTPQGALGAIEGTNRNLRTEVLAKTLSKSEVASARFEGMFTFVGAAGSDIPGEFTMTFGGAFDLANDSSEMSIDFGNIMEAAAAAEGDSADFALFGDFFSEPLEMITIGDKAWIKWGLFSLFTGTGDDVWIEGEADESDDITSGFGFSGSGSPTEMLDMLADADADIERIGTEELRGVSTTHYRALVDVEELAEDMTPAERAEFEDEFGSAPIEEFPMEFWIDDDGLLHRYHLDLTDPAFWQEADDELEGAEFTFDMWDHGADLGITPPPADQIVSQDELGFDLGALAG